MAFIEDLENHISSPHWSKLEKSLFIKKIDEQFLEDYITEAKNYKWYKTTDYLKESLNIIDSKIDLQKYLTQHMSSQYGNSTEYDKLINYCKKAVGIKKSYLHCLHILSNYNIQNNEERDLVISYRKTNHFHELFNLIIDLCSSQYKDDLINDNFFQSIFYFGKLEDVINELIKMRQPKKDWRSARDKRARLEFLFGLPIYDKLKLENKTQKSFAKNIISECNFFNGEYSLDTITRYIRAVDNHEPTGVNNILRDNCGIIKNKLNEYGYFSYSKNLEYSLMQKK